MRRFVLDTNFLLHLIRDSEVVRNTVAAHRLQDVDAFIILSVVTVAEIRVLAERNNWGNTKKKIMNQLVEQATVVDISLIDDLLMQAYVTLDVSSTRVGRKMGKNDLWIAATASVAQAALVTADGDFDHLAEHIYTIKTESN